MNIATDLQKAHTLGQCRLLTPGGTDGKRLLSPTGQLQGVGREEFTASRRVGLRHVSGKLVTAQKDKWIEDTQ